MYGEYQEEIIMGSGVGCRCRGPSGSCGYCRVSEEYQSSPKCLWCRESLIAPASIGEKYHAVCARKLVRMMKDLGVGVVNE